MYNNDEKYEVRKREDDEDKIKFTIRWEKKLFDQIERMSLMYNIPISQIFHTSCRNGLGCMEVSEVLRKKLDFQAKTTQILAEIALFDQISEQNQSKIGSFMIDIINNMTTNSKEVFSERLSYKIDKLVEIMNLAEKSDNDLYCYLQPLYDIILKNKHVKALIRSKSLIQKSLSDCPTLSDYKTNNR